MSLQQEEAGLALLDAQLGQQRAGGVRDHHLARLGDLLGQRDTVDVAAGDDQLDMLGIADLGGEDPPAVDADPQAQGEGAGAGFQRGELGHALLHRQRGAAGQAGVALAERGRVEEGRDRVAAELEQPAAVAVDLLDQRAEQVVDDRRDLFGALLAERAERARRAR